MYLVSFGVVSPYLKIFLELCGADIAKICLVEAGQRIFQVNLLAGRHIAPPGRRIGKYAALGRRIGKYAALGRRIEKYAALVM